MSDGINLQNLSATINDLLIVNQLTSDHIALLQAMATVHVARQIELLTESLSVGNTKLSHEKCKSCGKGIGGVCGACHCYCPTVHESVRRQVLAVEVEPEDNGDFRGDRQ